MKNPRGARSPRGGAVLMMALIVLLVVACSGGTEQPAPTTLPTAQQKSAVGNELLPGTEEFGFSPKELVNTIEQVETRIAKCMSDAGFEYVAAGYSTVRKAMIADKSLPGVSNGQYIDRYGYGISTLYSGRAPQLAEANTPAKLGLGPQNLAIFNQLSPAEQVAYNRTLFGENNDATFAVALEGEDLSRTGGCTRSAVSQVFAPEQLEATFYNPLDTRIEQDPRMITALGKFADCVRAGGFNYNRPSDIEPDLKKRLDAITSGAPIESLPGEARLALQELQGKERAVARIALDCTIKHVERIEEQIQQELYAGMTQ